MLLHDAKKTIIKRLQYISGQIGGIEDMIEMDRSLEDIYLQLRAVEKGINKVFFVGSVLITAVFIWYPELFV